MQHKEALKSATPNDVSSYEYHWSKVSQSHEDEDASLTIQSSIAKKYLSSHVAHKDAVELILLHLKITETLSKNQFLHATHLLYMSVRSAQEAIFDSDLLWADAPPATNVSHKKKLFVDKSTRNATQDGWVIGSMLVTADEEEEEFHDIDEQVDQQQQEQEQYSTPGPLESGLLSINRSLSNLRPVAMHLSPEQSLSDAISLDLPATTNTSDVTLKAKISRKSTPSTSATAAAAAEKEESEWKAFEDAFSQLKTNTSRDTHSGMESVQVSWRSKDKPLLSLDKAGAVLAPGSVPGTRGLMPMTPAQRMRCEAAFVSKGYAASGGVQRDEAFKIFQRARLENQGIFAQLWALCMSSSSSNSDFFDTLIGDKEGAAPQSVHEGKEVRLDHKEFTLFMYLLNALMSGHESIPISLTEEQKLLLLGESSGFLTARPFEHGHDDSSHGAAPTSHRRRKSSAIKLNTARLRAAIRATSSGSGACTEESISTSSGYQSMASPGSREAVAQNGNGATNDDECIDSDNEDANRSAAHWNSESEGTFDDTDDDDAESSASYSIFAEGAGLKHGISTPRVTSLDGTVSRREELASTTKLGAVHDTGTMTAAGEDTNVSSFPSAAVRVPRLALPGIQALAAAVTSARGPPTAERIPELVVIREPKTSRIERAAWEEEAGIGHCALQLRLRTAALTQKKPVDHAHVSLSVRDPLGRLVELPLESHPGIFRAEAEAVEFGDQVLTLKTGLRSLPPGCRLFLELKQWKADKKRMSTVAWSYVNVDMMVDSGPVCSRVRCGPMVLPLFKKPMDLTVRKCKRLNSRGPGLHVFVRGMEQNE